MLMTWIEKDYGCEYGPGVVFDVVACCPAMNVPELPNGTLVGEAGR